MDRGGCWAVRIVVCMAAFLREASEALKIKENLRKAFGKQAPPYPRKPRPYHGRGWLLPASGGASILFAFVFVDEIVMLQESENPDHV